MKDLRLWLLMLPKGTFVSLLAALVISAALVTSVYLTATHGVDRDAPGFAPGMHCEHPQPGVDICERRARIGR